MLCVKIKMSVTLPPGITTSVDCRDDFPELSTRYVCGLTTQWHS